MDTGAKVVAMAICDDEFTSLVPGNITCMLGTDASGEEGVVWVGQIVCLEPNERRGCDQGCYVAAIMGTIFFILLLLLLIIIVVIIYLCCNSAWWHRYDIKVGKEVCIYSC